MSFISPLIAHLFPDHGSPADRGRADAHYGRDLCPHKYVNNVRIELAEGSAEAQTYTRAYLTCTSQKNWD